MKPTASQLAKQNRPFQAGHSRSCMPVLDKTSKSTASTCVIENQAAKRQKLEGGLQRKVMGTVQLQQTNFVHKAPKRDGFPDANMTHTKPRITIPRDPELETAHRAQRTRRKFYSNGVRMSCLMVEFSGEKVILEAPSLLPKRSTPRMPDFQEFHLKTSERALQHSSTILKSTVPSNHSNKDLHKFGTNLTTDCGNREPARPSLMNNASRPDDCQSSHSFKALPLNKKILTSKGDIGIFRNCKKETTVPMEFNFQTDKRFHNNPPIELFNKLSLASETQPVGNSESKVPWSISVPAKIKQPAKLKLPVLGGMQQFSADVEKNEVSFASDLGVLVIDPVVFEAEE
ncbi:hypothetical protein DH2020_028664 [Rehmannia glutinosa]|uniref:TPX2 central domain-containing protein n=1 Tax=Rehmannia glutinosa TaxID=99300 RepID=A0ABR0VUC1_REHGL